MVDNMEKALSNYLHKHTRLITFVVVAAFVLLAAGEYYLYRNQMKLNKMVAEGLMQLKETNKPKSTPKIEFMMIGGKMAVRRDNQVRMMEKDMMTSAGDTVVTNGNIIKKDGSKIMLKEGDVVGLE